MKFIIKPFSELLNRADVKYNLDDNTNITSVYILEELKELIVRDPMCYGFQYYNKGIPLIRISDLKQPFIDYTNVAFISEQEHKRFSKTHLEKYDILMSVRGVSIGRIGIYMGEFEQANISPNIIIIRLKEKDMAPYVSIVLMSEIGQQQIKKIIAGSSKPTITAPLINQLEIPKIGKQLLVKLNRLFKEAYSSRIKSQELINEINKEFDCVFGNKKYNKRVVNTKNLKNAERWDPHYHNSKFEILRKLLLDFETDDFKDVCQYVDKTKNYKDSVSPIGYIEISDINNLTALIGDFRRDYIKNLPSGTKIPLIDKDILISKVRPYRNANVLFINHYGFECAASKNAFAVFRGSEYKNPYYLLAFIRSYYGLNQIIMNQSGTSYPTVSDDDIKTIKIPRLSQELISKIDAYFKTYITKKDLETKNIKKIIDLIKHILD